MTAQGFEQRNQVSPHQAFGNRVLGQTVCSDRDDHRVDVRTDIIERRLTTKARFHHIAATPEIARAQAPRFDALVLIDDVRLRRRAAAVPGQPGPGRQRHQRLRTDKQEILPGRHNASAASGAR